MNTAEFEVEFNRIAKINHWKDYEETKKYMFNKYKNLSIIVVKEILEQCGTISKYTPGMVEIKEAANYILNKRSTIDGTNKDRDYYSWVMSLPAIEARYYGENLTQQQQVKLLEKIKKDGFTKFEKLSSAPWWETIEDCCKEISSKGIVRYKSI